VRGSISFSPEPDPREEARAFKPRWRRAWDWVTNLHKFALTLAAIGGTTLAGHAWLKGLITRKELELAVAAAVQTEFATIKGDLETIKTNTGGLPEWRGDISIRLAKVEVSESKDHETLVHVQAQLDHQFVIRGQR
jgi:hypothetical protein